MSWAEKSSAVVYIQLEWKRQVSLLVSKTVILQRNVVFFIPTSYINYPFINEESLKGLKLSKSKY